MSQRRPRGQQYEARAKLGCDIGHGGEGDEGTEMNKGAEIAKAECLEWMCGAGIRLDVRLVVRFIQTLVDGYGDNFDLEKACDGLDSVAQTATLMAANMRRKEIGRASCRERV